MNPLHLVLFVALSLAPSAVDTLPTEDNACATQVELSESELAALLSEGAELPSIVPVSAGTPDCPPARETCQCLLGSGTCGIDFGSCGGSDTGLTECTTGQYSLQCNGSQTIHQQACPCDENALFATCTGTCAGSRFLAVYFCQ